MTFWLGLTKFAHSHIPCSQRAVNRLHNSVVVPDSTLQRFRRPDPWVLLGLSILHSSFNWPARLKAASGITRETELSWATLLPSPAQVARVQPAWPAAPMRSVGLLCVARQHATPAHRLTCPSSLWFLRAGLHHQGEDWVRQLWRGVQGG